jgi:hypothetical protein
MLSFPIYVTSIRTALEEVLCKFSALLGRILQIMLQKFSEVFDVNFLL